MSDDASSFSIGLTLFSTSVAITLSAKLCVPSRGGDDDVQGRLPAGEACPTWLGLGLGLG